MNNGGDPVPGPYRNTEITEVATETSLKIMISSLLKLEKAVRSERQELQAELTKLRNSQVAQISAEARVLDASG